MVMFMRWSQAFQMQKRLRASMAWGGSMIGSASTAGSG